MRVSDCRRECFAGGPGLDGYMYKCELYCEDCAVTLFYQIPTTIIEAIEGTDDPLFKDGETLPQPIFYGESDAKEHCGICGTYLYGGKGGDE